MGSVLIKFSTAYLHMLHIQHEDFSVASESLFYTPALACPFKSKCLHKLYPEDPTNPLAPTSTVISSALIPATSVTV